MSEKLGTLIVDIAADTTRMAGAQIAINQLAGKVAAGSAKMAASMQTFSDGVASVSGRMRSMGWLATTVLTMPILGVGKASIKMANDFEFSMRKIESLVGIASDQVQAWTKDVLAISAKTGKGPQELADAMFYITSAGLRGAYALDVLDASAKAATIGLGQTKEVADLVTSAMNAYGWNNLSAAEATDVLVATVREGKIEADQLATKMGMVLPVASAMGIKFSELGAATAAMSRTGTNASMAAVQLRQIMVSLLKPTKRANDTLTGMKTSAEELRKTIREKGLLVALMDLKSLSEEYGETVMAKVFGNVRALTGVLDILGSNLETNIEIFARMEKTVGDMERAYAIAGDTMKVKYAKELAKLKISQIEFGEVISKAILPILQNLVSWVDKITKQFAALDEQQQQSKIKWAIFLAVLGPAALTLSVLGMAINVVITSLLALRTAVIWTIAKLRLLNMTMLVNPWTAGLLALGMFIAFMVKLTKKTDDAVESQKEMNKVLQEAKRLNESFVDIREQSTVIDTMNARQLDEYEGRIKQQIALEQDLGLQIQMEYGNRSTEAEAFAQTVVKTSQDTNKTISALQTEQTKGYGSFYQNRIGGLQKTIDQEIAAEIEGNQIKLDAYAAYLHMIEKRRAEMKTPDYMEAEKKVILNNLEEELFYLENRKDVYSQIGIEFDYQKKKAEFLTTALDALARLGYAVAADEIESLSQALKKVHLQEIHKEYELGINVLKRYDLELKQIIKSTKEQLKLEKIQMDYGTRSYETMFRKTGASGFGASADSLFITGVDQELKKAIFMNDVFGDSLDSVAAQMGIVRKAIDDVYDSEGYRIQNQDALSLMDNLLERYKALANSQEDMRTQDLMSEREYLRKKYEMQMTAAEKAGKDTSLIAYNYAKSIRALNLKDLQMMLQTAGQALDAITNLVEANKQKELSAVGDSAKKREAIEKKYFERQKRMAIAQAIINGAIAVTNLLASVPGSVINPATWAAIAVAAVAAGAQVALIKSTAMAEGGIIPPGYANDTFPARLSSGEAVIPLNKISKYLKPSESQQGGEVEFVIRGDVLVGILKRQGRVVSSFS